ncbi:MAG: exosome complex protein Rrp42 [Candidatus Woesearchaeota archaeon]
MSNHIDQMLTKGFRFDKRQFDEFREVVIEKGATPNAEGSARVLIGETEVIAGVKMSVERPYPDTPENGNIAVNVELLPLSNPRFEPGPPQIQAVELARVVDRGIRESGVIDTKKLCITKGEKVWMIFIDICSINDAGNLRDAAALAAIASLQDARFPTYNEDGIDYKHKTDEKIPLDGLPIEVTVIKIGDHFIIDPTLEEEAVLEKRLTVATLEDGRICALQKGGDGALTSEDIEFMLTKATEKCQELRAKLED